MKRTPLKRKTELRRPGAKLPRHPMKRKRRPKPSDALLERMAAFKKAGVHLYCFACREQIWFEQTLAHHVVYRQHLPVDFEWDPRNAMPVCNACHERHHNGSRRIPLTALTEQNLEFARQVLGEAADHYLERRYVA